MSRFRPIPALRIARITFVLAGGILLVLSWLAGSAQAGCGDYVFVRNASGQLVRASTLMQNHETPCNGPHCQNQNSQPGQAKPAPPAQNIPSKLPCNGPNCSQRSEPPASPAPPAPQRSLTETTALLLQLDDRDADAGARFGGVATSNEHELRYPQSIFHPPR